MANLCSCGCGKEIKIGNIFLKGHARKGKKNSLEHNLALKKANFKGNIDIECNFCHKIFTLPKSNNLPNRKYPRKYCNQKCYGKSLLGRKLTEENKLKLILANTGRIRSEKERKAIGFANSKEKNGMWKEDSERNIKRRIRDRDNHLCLLCDLHQEQNGNKLDVHHIDYNQLNNLHENMITLCHSCHAKTNKSKRKFWIQHFHSILAEKYGYKYTAEQEILIELKREEIIK